LFQTLLDLLEAVGDQCAGEVDAGGRETPFSAFSRAQSSTLLQLKAARKGLVAQCEEIKVLAAGTTCDITLLSRGGRPCARKRIPKHMAHVKQGVTVAFAAERDLLARAETARAVLDGTLTTTPETAVRLPEGLTLSKLERVARLHFAYVALTPICCVLADTCSLFGLT
jgi:hypothetical protein